MVMEVSGSNNFSRGTLKEDSRGEQSSQKPTMMPMMISAMGRALPAGKLRKTSAQAYKRAPNVYEKAIESSPKTIKKKLRTRNDFNSGKNTDLEMIESDDQNNSQFEPQATHTTEIKSGMMRTGNLIGALAKEESSLESLKTREDGLDCSIV